MRLLPVALVSMIALGPADATPQGAPGRDGRPLALTHATVVDVTSGQAAHDMTLVVRDGRIAAVGQSGTVAVPTGARTVDARGKFVVPGLWDMHAHLWDHDVTVPLVVANGVTGIRDMGSDLDSTLALRESIVRGRRLGPRIVTAGPILDGPRDDAAEFHLAVATPEEARRAVDSLARRGVDFLKVYHFLGRDSYFAIADEAHRRGLPFAGHLPPTVTPIEAADAGQRSVEHLYGVVEHVLGREAMRSTPFVELVKRYDEAKADALFRHLAARGTWQTPTLAHFHSFAFRDVPDSGYVNDPHAAYLTAEMRRRWERYMPARTLPADVAANRAAGYRKLSEVVGAMQRSGVGILAGTDNGIKYVYPGFGLHDELARLVDAGLTPLQALQAATINAATFLAMADSVGTVQAGKVADLVLLDGDPLADIANTRRISAVVVGGRLIDAAARRRLLADARRAARRPAATPDGRR
jgi:imidazolonepropionase-like amidohydrolase